MQFFILLTCGLAVFCNASQYMCIGRFSATSFQVLGHMKTVCVLVLGWLFFDSALTAKNLLGMALTVLGMVVYSWAMEQDKQAARKAASLPTIREVEGEEGAQLLKSGGNADVELGAAKN